MRRLLLAALLVMPLMVATTVRAQAPAPAPAPAPVAPATPAPATAPEQLAPAQPAAPIQPSAAPAAAPEFVPDPETRPIPHWYGWQPAIFDVAAGLQAALAYGIDEGALYATAAATYVVGPLGVHLYHQRMGNVVVGAALRLGSPGIGAATGLVIDKLASNGRSNGTMGSSIGVGIGCLVAAIVDDAVNSHEMLQFWEASITVTPTISRDTRGLSLVGTF